ncbi:MAG: hflB2 [Ramlibacter sp.]|nr:hflB2 [Ramlibacter sp.]
MNNQWFSKIAVWLVIALVLFTVFKQFDTRGAAGASVVGYSDFLEQVRNKQIKNAVIQEGQGGTEIVAMTNDDRKVRTTATYLDRGLVGDLINNGVKFDVKPREEGSLLMTLLVSWGPMLLLIGVWIYFMRQMQGGGKGGAFSFGKSKARMLDESSNQITFADVAGCDEAKEEVKEVVDFLKARRRCLSSRSPAPTSSRCSSAWARPACATCSRTPRRTRPASSSSMKSTRWAASAAPASAAATTSASRP